MKEKIHPKYYEDAEVTCACGNKFTTGSTRKERRMLDTTGRVERFKRRYNLDK